MDVDVRFANIADPMTFLAFSRAALERLKGRCSGRGVLGRKPPGAVGRSAGRLSDGDRRAATGCRKAQETQAVARSVGRLAEEIRKDAAVSDGEGERGGVGGQPSPTTVPETEEPQTLAEVPEEVERAARFEVAGIFTDLAKGAIPVSEEMRGGFLGGLAEMAVSQGRLHLAKTAGALADATLDDGSFTAVERHVAAAGQMLTLGAILGGGTAATEGARRQTRSVGSAREARGGRTKWSSGAAWWTSRTPTSARNWRRRSRRSPAARSGSRRGRREARGPPGGGEGGPQDRRLPAVEGDEPGGPSRRLSPAADRGPGGARRRFT